MWVVSLFLIYMQSVIYFQITDFWYNDITKLVSWIWVLKAAEMGKTSLDGIHSHKIVFFLLSWHFMTHIP